MVFDWQEQRESCSSKKAYSKKTAQTIKNLRERDGAGTLKIYQCPVCNQWHLSHRR